jgi:hypothetical protein
MPPDQMIHPPNDDLVKIKLAGIQSRAVISKELYDYVVFENSYLESAEIKNIAEIQTGTLPGVGAPRCARDWIAHRFRHFMSLFRASLPYQRPTAAASGVRHG